MRWKFRETEILQKKKEKFTHLEFESCMNPVYRSHHHHVVHTDHMDWYLCYSHCYSLMQMVSVDHVQLFSQFFENKCHEFVTHIVSKWKKKLNGKIRNETLNATQIMFA